MVATPVIDRTKPISLKIAPDIADRDARQNNPIFITLDEYRAIAETAEERLNIEIPLSEIYRRIIGIS
jgi:hypothetical protein